MKQTNKQTILSPQLLSLNTVGSQLVFFTVRALIVASVNHININPETPDEYLRLYTLHPNGLPFTHEHPGETLVSWWHGPTSFTYSFPEHSAEIASISRSDGCMIIVREIFYSGLDIAVT